MINLDSVLKSRDITLPTKVHLVKAIPFSQSYSFSSSHVQIWELDHKTSLSTEELMLLNCGSGKDSYDSSGLKEDQISQS